MKPLKKLLHTLPWQFGLFPHAFCLPEAHSSLTASVVICDKIKFAKQQMLVWGLPKAGPRVHSTSIVQELAQGSPAAVCLSSGRNVRDSSGASTGLRVMVSWCSASSTVSPSGTQLFSSVYIGVATVHRVPFFWDICFFLNRFQKAPPPEKKRIRRKKQCKRLWHSLPLFARCFDASRN